MTLVLAVALMVSAVLLLLVVRHRINRPGASDWSDRNGVTTGLALLITSMISGGFAMFLSVPLGRESTATYVTSGIAAAVTVVLIVVVTVAFGRIVGPHAGPVSASSPELPKPANDSGRRRRAA